MFRTNSNMSTKYFKMYIMNKTPFYTMHLVYSLSITFNSYVYFIPHVFHTEPIALLIFDFCVCSWVLHNSVTCLSGVK